MSGQHLPKIDIDRVYDYAPADLVGREAELALLDQAWARVANAEPGRPHILSLVALGGEGKTSLVAHWLAQQAQKDWPRCEAAFAWSFYSQGTRDQSGASADVFFNDALRFFGDAETANSSLSAYDKGKKLARLVGAAGVLLILDGLEPLQYGPGSPTQFELKDPGIIALLKGLAVQSRGLCLITTRYTIPELAGWSTTAPVHRLTSLSLAAGETLLRKLGVNGRPAEYEQLVKDVQGHALTLHLLGSYLRDAHHGDIRRRDRVDIAEANAAELGGHAFHVMDAYVAALQAGGEAGLRALALLRLLGLFDRPATADCIDALLQPPAIAQLTEPLVGLDETARTLVQTRLQGIELLTVNRDAGRLLSLDAHPLLREYFAERLSRENPDAWRVGHRRLYEHLRDTTREGKRPNLGDLQPLYQAVAHGCKAGLQQQACDEVYFSRIQRGHEAYSNRRLGAFGDNLGVLACFFDLPWSSMPMVRDEVVQSWLLNGAGFALRALGRLGEARQPFETSLRMSVSQQSWQHAVASANNLSELAVMLGDLPMAESYAESALEYADEYGEEFMRIASHTSRANALHHGGKIKGAMGLFREAEQMQVKWQPDHFLLYSLQGFQYADLLLGEIEAAVWRRLLESSITVDQPRVEPCQAVFMRASQTLEWAEKSRSGILNIGLDHLTRGRAMLYGALETNRLVAASGGHIERAVAGLRGANAQEFVPLGLLAPFCATVSAPASAPIAPRKTSTKLGRLPSAGQCRCTWPTSTCTARGCSAAQYRKTKPNPTPGAPLLPTWPRRGG